MAGTAAQRSEFTSEQRPVAVMRGARYLIADGHVHWYDCFDAADFLDCAFDNLASVAQRTVPADSSWHGALLFTEAQSDAAFERLAQSERSGAWRVDSTPEGECLRLSRDDGAEMAVIAGRQIATREDLEVLAIGTLARVPDRLPLGETLEQVREIDAAAIIPWGFGKWTARRGRLLRALLDISIPGDFALGDNGGRLAASREPRLLELARQRGFRVFSGSDPLPFPDQVRRVGAFGFVVEDWREDVVSASAVKDLVRSDAVEPHRYGTFAGPFEFGASQIRMQIRKRLR